MPAPKGFGDLTAKQRDDFSAYVSWVNFLNPSITLDELIGSGAPSGGGSAGAAPQHAGALGAARPKLSHYDRYKKILPYWRDIEKAAANHGIDKYILATVIMWESTHAKEGTGEGGAVLAVMWDGWGASVGISQLELYKARLMLIKHKGKHWENATLGQVRKQMLHPPTAIHLAAAWMSHLKMNIRIQVAPGEYKFISDEQAAIAYCGCSGVVVMDKKGNLLKEMNAERFTKWMETGKYSASSAKNKADAEQRRADLEWLWNNKVGQQYFDCAHTGCGR